jgi:molybdenum cofactor guanylyltransferase
MLQIPPLFGLVLTGGKSSRMGTDKAWINYHGMPQWQYAAQMLHQAGIDRVYISCRPEQEAQFAPFPCIPDQVSEIGPMAGIAAAFAFQPEAAWFVLACDLPALDAHAIAYLIERRDWRMEATHFEQPDQTHCPEPLAGIWEPSIHKSIEFAINQGQFSPLKVLNSAQLKLISAPVPDWLDNVNTPEKRRPYLKK